MKIQTRLFCLLAVFTSVFSDGCGGMKLEMFENSTPKFTLEEYFAGKTRAWGLVHNRSDKLVRQFVVDIQGDWKDGELVLTENFNYSDGAKDQRIWHIKKLDEHHYEGRAADVVGVAKGVQYGQALNWSYDLNLKVDNSTYRVHFNDWMYLQPDNVLANRALFSKFGVNLGEVMLFFRKE